MGIEGSVFPETACEYQYLFSVIVPVYNTEQYLDETLESVIGQTIGFRDNIQLILINNATEDNSGKICERYQAKFPENVTYVVLKENNGPCAARNAGIPYIKGKYVNFLDSDDKWELDAFENIYPFFEQHYKEIDIVACRIKHFDAIEDWHGLDRKFLETGIKSIFDDYTYVQLSLCSTFIKGETVSRYRFDERVRHAEDAKYISEILMEQQKYALIREVVFYYRTRKTGASVVQNVGKSRSWYFDTPKYVFEYLFGLSKKIFGTVIPYIQYLVMYEIQWRLKTPLPAFFSEDEIKEYRDEIRKLLEEIDDFIIWEQRNLWREFKLFALSIKYGKQIHQELISRGGELWFHNIKIYPKRTSIALEIPIVDIENETLYIEGRVGMVLPKNTFSIFAQSNGTEYPVQFFELDESAKRFSLGEIIHEVVGFKVEIPICQKTDSVSFYLIYQGTQIQLGYHFSFICKMTTSIINAYWRCGKYVLRSENGIIKIYPYTPALVRRFERDLDKELIKNRQLKVLGWRWLITFLHFLFAKRKPIWLVLDGFAFAGDNGEFFFQYLMKRKDLNIRPYFVIDRNSKDYSRMKAIGPVIPADTKKYRIFFALANKVISSQSFYNKLNTFYDRTELLQDLFHFDFIYLQHGVIKDNHADTQSRHKKDFSLFITSAEKEKNSIINGIGGNYCYNENVVKVTGLARHDLISFLPFEDRRKKVLLAPTWRMEGVGIWDEKKQTYAYHDGFKNTEFYCFYQKLMNEPRILKSMQKNGYTMHVRLHPRSIQQASDFSPGEGVTLEYEREGYAEELRHTSLLITDYSSIAFDYAYAGIPVIYTQFDVDTFYLNHGYKKGYFDYEQDGFGPICYDYESAVQAIVAAIESGWVVEEKYQRRVGDFFAYHDGKNCERIYNAILELDERYRAKRGKT